jgi:hypothetical protein
MAMVFERAFGELVLVVGGSPYMLVAASSNGVGNSGKFRWTEEGELPMLVRDTPSSESGVEVEGPVGERRKRLSSLAQGAVSLSMWFGGEHRPARVTNQQLQRQLIRVSQLLGELDYWELQLDEKVDILKVS